jgi:hypothetical protein
MTEPAIGQIGGRYQLTDVIGKGGMGIVYRGFDVAMSRQVAIKMLLGFDAEDRETVLARFHREVTSLAALQHRNIVTIYTFEQYEGKPYMVMEYLEGKSLQQIISSKEAIELTEKLNLIVQVCDGLQYAHDNGIVHRDIKPANILVLKNGTAKLIDFGIARAGRNETITQPGQVIGSLSYMSPEQLSSHPLDARTDVFSAGVVLFQLLTGNLPFQGADMSAIISQILNAPCPSLGTYVKDLPKELDQIVERALAKKPDERYQSAEEFGFDISRVLETLKRGLAGEFIRRAKACIERQDWEAARQQLQEVRKIDRRNDVANDMFQMVTREIQRQQKFVQIAQLRSQAQLALLESRYEEALECLEQGLRIDGGDAETLALREVVKQRIKRAKDLDNALRRSQAAFYAGDLAEAQSAIEQALAFEPEHTEARSLEHLIRKEVAERNKRVQLQSLLDSARTEIGKKNFVEALQFIRQAQAIDPADASIQELLSWASRGHSQEKARKALEGAASEIGHLLREDRYQEALLACDAALVTFPDEISLLKLRELAQRQFEIQARRIAVEEVGNTARRHAAAGEYDHALELLETALQTYPGDTSLETFLAITRAELDQKQREAAERAEFQERNEERVVTAEPTIQEAETLELLQSFRSGLMERSPISELQETAERLASVANKHRLGPAASAQYSTLLAEYQARQRRVEQDLAKLESLRSLVSASNAGTEITRVLERARSISDSYPKEDRFSLIYQEIFQLAQVSKQKREDAATESSDVIRAMQTTQDISQLLLMEKRVQEASKNWPNDASIHSLAEQASTRLEEVRAHKGQILDELAQVESSLASARSLGQLRLIEEQANGLAADLARDADVGDAVSRIALNAHSKVQLVNNTCLTLRELTSKITSAQTLEEAEKFARDAQRAISEGANYEEVDDLFRKVQHLVEDRKKDYARIERNLQLLIERSVKATGLAELDLILARRRDSVKRYPAEVHFSDLEARLEASVRERRLQLAELAASEQWAESPPEEPEEGTSTDDRNSGSESIGTAAKSPIISQAAATGSLRAPRRGIPRAWLLLTGGFLAAAVVVVFIVPRSVQIRVNPATANIQVDGQGCEAPCSVRLMPGQHALTVTSPGFDEIHRVVSVPWFGGELPALVMKRTPVSSPAPTVAIADTDVRLGGNSKIIVNTTQPGATVFVDGKAAGTTSKVQVPSAGLAKNDLNQSPSQQSVSSVNSQPVTNTPVTPPPPPDSFIVVEASAGAEVHVDQEPKGHSTGGPFKIKVEPGQRTVEVFLAGFQLWKQPVTVDPGKEVNVVATLTPLPGPPTTPSSPVSRSSTGISDEDRKEIQQLLDRYAEGYNQKNVKLIQATWPSIPPDKLKKIKDSLREAKTFNMKLSIIDAVPAGARITVDCQQRLRFNVNGKDIDQTHPITLYVRKRDSSWEIEFVPNA